MHRVRTSTALVALAAVLAGCRDDGRTLEPSPPVPVSRITTTTLGVDADPGAGVPDDVG